MGVPERAATAVWWSVSRAWVARDRVAPEELTSAVRSVGRLDPTWRTPWIYGGLMLQVQGDGVAAAELLHSGIEQFPDDPWFPAALGVQLADQGRLDEARAWLDRAREQP